MILCLWICYYCPLSSRNIAMENCPIYGCITHEWVRNFRFILHNYMFYIIYVQMPAPRHSSPINQAPQGRNSVSEWWRPLSLLREVIHWEAYVKPSACSNRLVICWWNDEHVVISWDLYKLMWSSMVNSRGWEVDEQWGQGKFTGILPPTHFGNFIDDVLVKLNERDLILKMVI